MYGGRALLKECILRRDPRLTAIMQGFHDSEADEAFVERVNALVESEALALHADVFDECPLEVAKALSKRERNAKQLDGEKSLIYGEVEFGYFARVLRKIAPRNGGVFYDLGSTFERGLKAYGQLFKSFAHASVSLLFHRFPVAGSGQELCQAYGRLQLSGILL